MGCLLILVCFICGLFNDTSSISDYRHSPNLRRTCVQEGPAQVEFYASPNSAYVWLPVCSYVLVQACPADIQTPAHWNLIGRSITAAPPVLSPSSNLPPPLSHCAFIPARKYLVRVSKIFKCFDFFLNCVNRGVSARSVDHLDKQQIAISMDAIPLCYY